MTKVRSRGEAIRKYLLENIDEHPSDVSSLTAEKFKITRQAVNKHLKRLIEEGSVSIRGNTRNKNYKLAPISEWTHSYDIIPELAEDVIWRKEVAVIIGKMPDNVIDIWHHAFTEMFNNAVDHSGGSKISVHIKKTAANTEMMLSDNGIGIFKKIQSSLNLLDERHAILELSKGKLTTDPKRHSGEGIFFTSRMFDSYDILSGGIYYSHKFGKLEDWILERDQFSSGTVVWMKLDNHTSRTVKQIFDKFTAGEGFSKTIVPVRLVQYGNDKLVSRSQAKRLLARVELFKIVIFDFEGVGPVGQAFADEIFRVFTAQHPEILITSMNEDDETKQMIKRAKSGLTIPE